MLLNPVHSQNFSYYFLNCVRSQKFVVLRISIDLKRWYTLEFGIEETESFKVVG